MRWKMQNSECTPLSRPTLGTAADAGDGRRRRQWPDLVLSEDTSCLLLP